MLNIFRALKQFDQQANIDEIDNLMSTYKDWEEK